MTQYFKAGPPPEKRAEVKFCPSCGRKPEESPGKPGVHIWSVFCEKCQARFTIWVIK